MIVNYFYSPGLPHVIHQDFEPYNFNTQEGYHKCYAHKWSVMNRFKIKCPYELDFNLSFKEDRNVLIKFNNIISEKTFNRFVISNPQQNFTVDTNKFVFQLRLLTSFYTKEKCFMELNHPEHLDSNLKLIKGKYDISKWLRPLNAAIEVQKLPCRVVLSREDILGELVFHAEKINEPIKLKENIKPSDELIYLSQENSQITDYVSKAKTLIERGSKLLKRCIR